MSIGHGREGYRTIKTAAMDAKKATKAALNVKEAVVKYELKASEDVKKSSRQPQT